MITSNERRTVALMGVVGAVFVALATATGASPWWAAAAINFLGATAVAHRQHRLACATA